MGNFVVAKRGAVLLGACVVLSGCGSAWYAPPDQFATAPQAWANNRNIHDHHPYDPVVRAGDEVRADFVIALQEICAEPIRKAASRPQGTADDYSDPAMREPCKLDDLTSYQCWAAKHRLASRCADAVAVHAINQCVAKSGGQNMFTAKANIILGTVYSLGSLAADAAAITSNGSNATTAIIASSAINSGVNNARNFAPPVVTPKVSDMTGAEQSYVQMAHLTDEDVGELSDPELVSRTKAAPNATSPEQARRDLSKAAAMKFSRLHDAVFAACPVGAY